MKTKVIGNAQRPKIQGFAAAISAVLLLGLLSDAQASGRQALHGHVPDAVRRLQAVDHYAGTNQLKLAIGLPTRNSQSLSDLLKEIYDPRSPSYHHYITPQQFTEQFGPTEEDYQAVMAFARSNHLRVAGRDPSRTLVDVEGASADIEKALHVTIRVYRHPAGGRLFHAPDAEPWLDLAVPVLHISGLDDYSLPQPRLQAVRTSGKRDPLSNGSATNGGYIGTDFRKAYVPDTTLDGTGQVIGLVQFDGYATNDIIYYENQAGLTNITITNVLIDGASGSPSNTGGTVETPLDIEMAMCLSTNISKVMVYIEPNTSPWEDVLNQMANDNVARQLSCSWFAPGAPSDPVADGIFVRMAAQGQTFVSASGDSNAWTGLMSFPEDSPYITQVGGTTLTTTGPGGSYVSETVWNEQDGIGSAGGISTQYAIPSWQTNISMAINQGSTTMRNTPDVAMTGDNVYVRAGGIDYVVGGTSCAAPLWASFLALANQQAAAVGNPSVGFLNPAIDIIGTGANYTTVFHDITTGNNTSSASPNSFYAVPGYDLCTGWGTPSGQATINALANPEVLLSPAAGFSSIGPLGGPFSVSAEAFSFYNPGSISVNWSAGADAPWLTTSPSGGALAPRGTATTVTVSLNSAASSLPVGIYISTVSFTNLFSGITQSRQITLNVGLPPSISTEPADQTVLTGGGTTFNVAVSSAGPCTYQWQFNGNNLPENIITTFAGNGLGGAFVSGIEATNASLNQPFGLALDSAGDLYIADVGHNSIRKVAPGGIITTVAGNGTSGYSGDGGPATSAELNNPYGVAADAAGNVYIADLANNRVRKVDTTGKITTVAGNGSRGHTGDAGAAVSASIAGPVSVAVDGSGNLFIAELDDFTVREVSPGGTISTIAGINGIVGYSGDGIPATNVSLSQPFGIAVDGSGNLYIADFGNSRVRKVDANGIISTVAGNGTPGRSGDGGLATSAEINEPYDVAVDSLGNLFITDSGNNCIREVNANGIITTVAGNGSVGHSGDGGPATSASLAQPYGLAVDGSDDLFIAETAGGRVREATLEGSPTLALSQVTLSSGGSYAVIVSNAWGSVTSSVAILTVDSPPIITNQPQSLTVLGGTAANFGVGQAGTAPFAYFWQKDGTNLTDGGEISGSATTNLILSDTVATDGGSYAVIVSNAFGAATSSVATLTVAFPPTISAQPKSLIVTNENSAVFSVGVSGTAPLVYSWQKNGTNLANGGNVAGAATSNLILGATTTNDTGNYAVIITNAWGSVTSATVSLTVAWPPQITAQPLSLMATNGNAAGFSVTAVGAGPLSYQWQENQTNLTDGGNISGSATNSLVLSPATTNNAGDYAVIITNVWGSVTSSAAMLTVAWPPVITNQPQNLTVTNGNPASFSVAVSGAAPFTYWWQKNQTNLTDGGEITGSATTNLVLSATTTNDAGNYTILVSNVWGSVTSSVATLTVAFPPVIANQPQNLMVTNGNPAGFGIGVLGAPPLAYFWQKNQAALIDGGNISGSATSNLLLSVTTTNDSGSYSVIVTNIWGAQTSSVATLTVAWPPVITAQPQSVIVSNGNPGSFSVTVSGSGPLSYFWQKNQSGLTDGGNISGSGTSNLVLSPTTVNDQGNYAVIVSNVWGSMTSSVAVLTDAAAPVITSQPQSLIVSNGNTASFSVAAAGGLPLTFQWQKNQTNLTDGANISGSGTTSLVVGTVSGGDDGSYTVIVTNAWGSVTSSVAGLGIPQPPVITQEPVNELVAIGDTAKFSVGITGAAPFVYQWEFNGTNLPNNTILTVAGNGAAKFAGDGGYATNASLANPYSASVDSFGNLFIVDLGNSRIRKVNTNGIITTVAGNGGFGFSGDGAQATNASLSDPYGVVVDPGGNFYIADLGNHRVRKVGTNGIITTVAGSGVPIFSGDGGPATLAGLTDPSGVALDSATNLYIADPGSGRVRKVDASGTITTVAGNGNAGFSGDGGFATNATLNGAYSVTVDSLGNIYIADSGNYRVRKVDTNGVITTVAGNGFAGSASGIATNATLNEPYSVSVDSFGDLLIANLGDNSISRVDTTGIITTIAGNGTAGYSGDGETAISASMNEPYGVALDSLGNLYIADSGNNRVREVTGFRTLTLNDANTNNIGSYLVVVSNAWGSVTSSPATLTVVSEPVITNQPQSLTVTNGNSAGFTVAVTGTLPLVYRWQKNQTNLTNAGNISGSTSTNLALGTTTATDSGSYTVIASNAWGSVTSSIAVLTVASPPMITAQPQNLTVTNGNPARFSATVSGGAPLAYSWQKNQTNLIDGGNISGSATDSLLLSLTTTNDAGGYDIIISNVWGMVTSSVATLTVAAPPVITSQPESLRVTNGTPTNLSVVVSGDTPLIYHWRRGQTNLIDGGDVSGSATASLVFSLTATNDAGSYAVVVSNVWGSVTSQVATLTVAGPPVFTSQPQNLTVTNGNPAGFHVVVSGSGPIIYRWQKNQKNLVNNADISGTATANVTWSLATTNDTGNYSVIVSNVWGVATSSVATLTVAWPPVITNQPQGLTVTNGNPAGFRVAASGAGPLTYQWQKNQTNLIDGGNISGSLTTNLALSTTTTNDSGNYSVVVSNVWGVATSSVAALTVAWPPVITNQPQSLTVTNGNPASFRVAASGAGPLTYQWQKNQTNLIDAGDISGSATSNLVVGPVTLSDDGDYTVVITNSWGSVTSSTASLTVIIPPAVITQQPVSQGVSLGGNVTFSVVVSSVGPVTYQWQLNGTNLPGDIISTVAGNGAAAYSGDGGLAYEASLSDPYGIAVDGSRNLYIADLGNSRVRKVDVNGFITTVAGNGSASFSGDGGQATNASIGDPLGVAVDGAGNMFVSDILNNRVREIATNGVITTVAGSGGGSVSGNPNAAINTALNAPYGVAVGGSGNLFIADLGNNRVCKVDTNGILTTVAGNGAFGFSGDGGPGNIARLNGPYGVAVDSLGNLFIADSGNRRIRKVDTNGIITTVVGNGTAGNGTGPATGPSLDEPYGVAVDGFGEILIADLANDCIRKVDTNGMISTVAGNGGVGYAGDGGAATNAQLDEPYGVATDASGNLFIGDTANNRVRAVALGGIPTLTLEGVTTNDAGNYTVIVANARGSVTSSVAVLTVGVPPSITSQPESLTVTNGDPASFTVGVSGDAPFTFQWQRNQTDLTDGGEISGSATDNLVFGATTTNDAGSYTVIVSNPYGSATSSVAGLTIAAPPVAITTQPASQVVVAGGTTTFSVDVSGLPPISYYWSFDGTNIAGATSSSLVLTGVQFNQAGSYSVLASNLFGSSLSSNAVLTVTADHFGWGQISSPKFVNAPFAVTVEAFDGNNALLSGFTGTVALDSPSGVAVSPSVTGSFAQGAWTGMVTISQVAANLVLRASDGLGHTGLANSINVLGLPTLTLAATGNTLEFQWPVGYPNVVLETSASTAKGTWSSVPVSPIPDGDHYDAYIPIPSSISFYRLRLSSP